MNKVLALLIMLSFACFISAKELRGKVIKVSDGDTVVLLDSDNKKHRIRLDGIDCPEKKQSFGAKATTFVYNLCYRKVVTVKYQKKDRYGRILGYVYIDDVCINEELLKNGLAWHYSYFNKDQHLADLEMKAKKQKLNIWSEKNPIEPYQFRKMQKKKKNKSN